jgi:hypothetical protein
MSIQRDARRGEVAADDWRVQGKKRKLGPRLHLIEWRHRLYKRDPTRRVYVQSSQWGAWSKLKAYENAALRDQNLEKCRRVGHRSVEYRATDLSAA